MTPESSSSKLKPTIVGALSLSQASDVTTEASSVNYFFKMADYPELAGQLLELIYHSIVMAFPCPVYLSVRLI